MIILKKRKFIIILLAIPFLIFISCNNSKANNDLMFVHFIDIGQGDSTLINVNNKNVLIDSGPNSAESDLISYLKKNKIKKLDYLITTHPHEDHIGNIDSILKTFKVENFLAPKTIYDSKDFKNMIVALKEKNMNIDILSNNSSKINLGENIKVDIFSSKSNNHENINNYSPLIKISFINTSFLFTGDAEEELEQELLDNNIDSDVLKVGHHGSSTSSSESFLSKVSPNISVISCGINNKFNHPTKETLDKLKSIESTIYRTDEDGTIVLVSNGYKIIKK
ncbi:ComEC/Rec2 family competence protein [Clostridium mediterraneense]|uniref:ComEC/Rec2 family competence protein n=1 Tax=Clostridium mediterraneense TaxID=1805472 RepID=UPI00083639CB